jgi:hypothetical protein
MLNIFIMNKDRYDDVLSLLVTKTRISLDNYDC